VADLPLGMRAICRYLDGRSAASDLATLPSGSSNGHDERSPWGKVEYVFRPISPGTPADQGSPQDAARTGWWKSYVAFRVTTPNKLRLPAGNDGVSARVWGVPGGGCETAETKAARKPWEVEGAATIGLELADAVPSFDAVLIALGGGALATGVGHVVKALAPEVEVICVQPLGAPAMTHSWRQRRVVTTDSTSTIADGVAGRRPIPAVLDDLLLVADDAVLVSEASIIAGMRMLLDHAGLVVEPSAALGIAAILEDRDRFVGRHVVTIVCGSNVDVDAYHRWVGAAPTRRS
jgi:Pyridoxal-phosphate dependent enzyme